MSPILWTSSLRYMKRHPWQLILAILGVALGVAVVVSIDLARESSLMAFKLSTESIFGKSTHQITGPPNGLLEKVYFDLRMNGNFRKITPVVDGYVSATDYNDRTFHLLGIDPITDSPFRPYLNFTAISTTDILPILTQPGTVFLPEDTAKTMGLSPGDRINIRAGSNFHQIILSGIIKPEDELSKRALENIMVCDISTAQELLDKGGFLSWIDMIVPEGKQGEEYLRGIKAVLPKEARIVSTGTRTKAMENITRAFNLNLMSLGLLALIVGMFLIYNTMTFSVVQRRIIIGMLRSLGVSSREIFLLIMSEAFIIGIIGTFAGFFLGIILGKGMIKLVSQAINDIYFVLSVTAMTLSSGTIIKGFLLGIFATSLSAFIPAIEAIKTPAGAVMNRSREEINLHFLLPWLFWGGLLIIISGMAFLFLYSKNLVISLICLFIVVMGFSMITPAYTLFFTSLLIPAAGAIGGIIGKMAARGIKASLSRTSVAIAALMIAISITVGVGITVGSLRQTVEGWMADLLRADVYVTPPSLVYAQTELKLDPDLLWKIYSTPGILSVINYRGIMIQSDKGFIQVVAMTADPKRENAFRFKSRNTSDIWPEFDYEEGVIVSDPYAYRYNTEVGSTITLPTDKGEKSFKVLAISYDYTADQGVIIMSRNTYLKYWNDRGVSSIGIYLIPGINIDNFVELLRNKVGNENEVLIQSNLALREATIDVFDRTFIVTDVLRILAIIVAFVGIISSLMALQLERGREIAVLRAKGLTPFEVWKIVIIQTLLMGLIAGFMALILGIVLAMILIFIINRQSFGWSMEMHLEPVILIQGVIMSMVAAFLAGLYPAYKMSITSPGQALKNE